MIITESELRRIIRSVIIEEAAINEGPRFDNFMRQAGLAGAIGASALGAMGGMGPSTPAHALKPSQSISQLSPRTKELFKKVFDLVEKVSYPKKSRFNKKQDAERLIEIIEESSRSCDWDELLDPANANRIEDLVFGYRNARSFLMSNLAERGEDEARDMSYEVQHLLQRLHGVSRH